LQRIVQSAIFTNEKDLHICGIFGFRYASKITLIDDANSA
jgi:hypothetical protein